MPGNRREKETTNLVVFYFLAASILFFDQATKFAAVHFLTSVDSIPFIPNILHWTLVYNKGVAFGFFREHPGILLGLISLSLIFLIVWGARMAAQPWTERAALALILGGAFGNWVDRVRIGAVIDFIDFRIWPVFNAADSAITLGVVFFLLVMIKGRKA